MHEGHDVALLTLGPVGNAAEEAVKQAEAEGISVLHIDLRYAKPLDEVLLDRVGREFTRVVTVEDGVVHGGVGSAVLTFMNERGYTPQIQMLGVGDEFVTHGKQRELQHLCGYDAEGILQALRAGK